MVLAAGPLSSWISAALSPSWQNRHTKRHQPVASCLGRRFYDWQLAQPADKAMRGRCLHARSLLRELNYPRLVREHEHQERPHPEETLPQTAEDRAKYEIGQPDHHQKDILE